MKTTERFDKAVTKLYNAFHNNSLNAMDCAMCAVGNMCDNNPDWAFTYKTNTGYSAKEIKNIEQLFMHGYNINTEKHIQLEKSFSFSGTGFGWDAKDVKCTTNKHLVFIALCAVVEYLCELDNIPNVMDYTKLFETENDKPKYQLL